MSIDWKLLVELRERQKTRAMEVAARDRTLADKSRGALAQAEHHHLQQVDAKAAHWQATRAQSGEGRLDVAGLRAAGAWSVAMDTQIARAKAQVQSVDAAHCERQQTLDASLKRLRAATGGVEKAQQMRQRTRGEHLRLSELRMEEAADEAATLGWASRRNA